MVRFDSTPSNSDGAVVRFQCALIDSVMNVSTSRFCWRQVFDHSQQRFHEPAPWLALGAEAQLAPDRRATQRALRRVIRRFHLGMFQKHPSLIEPPEQVATHRNRPRMPTPLPVIQSLPQRLHQLTDIPTHRRAGVRQASVSI